LLEPAWSATEDNLAEPAHDLSALLGDDHDLALLHQTLEGDPLAFGGRRDVNAILSLIKRRRAALERQAFRLGRSIYRDTPVDFTKRIGRAWREWRGLAA
jgi:hypothetical protein